MKVKNIKEFLKNLPDDEEIIFTFKGKVFDNITSIFSDISENSSVIVLKEFEDTEKQIKELLILKNCLDVLNLIPNTKVGLPGIKDSYSLARKIETYFEEN